MRKFIHGLTALGLIFVVTSRSSGAGVAERKALAQFAEQIQKFLKGNAQTQIEIVEFEGPPSAKIGKRPGLVDYTGSAFNKSRGGLGFVELLRQELAKRNILVRKGAKFRIEGVYFLTEVPANNPGAARNGNKMLALKIESKFIDSTDTRKKFNFTPEVLIEGEEPLLRVFGGTTPLAPLGTELERNQVLRKVIQNKIPLVRVEKSKVRSKKNQPYAIEILVDDKVVVPHTQGGFAFITLKRNDEYAVRILNGADHEVAVELAIDGLSMFTFSKVRHSVLLPDGNENPQAGEPLYTCVIVPARTGNKPGEAIVHGWHRTNKPGGQDRFKITEYSKSALGRLGKPAGQCTITASFRAAWKKDEDPPRDEPGKAKGIDDDRTGFGAAAGEGFEEVERETGVLRDTISIRYNVKSDE